MPSLAPRLALRAMPARRLPRVIVPQDRLIQAIQHQFARCLQSLAVFRLAQFVEHLDLCRGNVQRKVFVHLGHHIAFVTAPACAVTLRIFNSVAYRRDVPMFGANSVFRILSARASNSSGPLARLNSSPYFLSRSSSRCRTRSASGTATLAQADRASVGQASADRAWCHWDLAVEHSKAVEAALAASCGPAAHDLPATGNLKPASMSVRGGLWSVVAGGWGLGSRASVPELRGRCCLVARIRSFQSKLQRHDQYADDRQDDDGNRRPPPAAFDDFFRRIGYDDRLRSVLAPTRCPASDRLAPARLGGCRLLGVACWRLVWSNQFKTRHLRRGGHIGRRNRWRSKRWRWRSGGHPSAEGRRNGWQLNRSWHPRRRRLWRSRRRRLHPCTGCARQFLPQRGHRT